MRRKLVRGWVTDPATSDSDLLLLDSFVVVVHVSRSSSNVTEKILATVKPSVQGLAIFFNLKRLPARSRWQVDPVLLATTQVVWHTPIAPVYIFLCC